MNLDKRISSYNKSSTQNKVKKDVKSSTYKNTLINSHKATMFSKANNPLGSTITNDTSNFTLILEKKYKPKI